MSIDLNPHALYFPIKRGTKLPLVKGWQGVATDEPHVIEGWLTKGHSLGAVPKPGYMVLDLDVKDSSNGIEWLANNRPALPETWLAQTARGGQHHWFKLPEGVQIGNKTGFNPGMDIRAAGKGFVVFHGKFEGKPYEQKPFEGELPIAPQWIIEDAQAKPSEDKFADEGSAVISHKGAVVNFYQQSLQKANDTVAQNLDDWDDTASNFAWYTAHMYFHGEDLTSKYLEHDLVLDLDNDKPGRGSGKLALKLAMLEAQYEHMDELEEERDAEFWQSTEMLQRISKLSDGKGISPWAVLGHSLTFVSANTSHNVMTEAHSGESPAGLNFYVASVGNSGDGKGKAFNAARDALEVENVMHEISSGEVLVQMIGKSQELEDDEDQGDGRIRFTSNPSTFLRSDEISNIGTKAERPGSTIWSTLMTVWSGFDLSNNAVHGKSNATVARNSYRCVLAVDVQPRNAGYLLNEQKSGLPQRFLWVSATPKVTGIETVEDIDPDGYLEAERKVREVGGLGWVNPFPSVVHNVTQISLPAKAKREMWVAKQRKKLETNDYSEEVDGHDALIRTKVATLLALLHGEKFVSEQMWELSAEIMAHSDKTLARCEDVATHFAQLEQIKRATSNAKLARFTAQKEEELSQADMPIAQFAQEVVLPKIQEDAQWSKTDLSNKFPAETRAKAKEGIAWLVAQGSVAEVKNGRKTTYEIIEQEAA